MLKIRTRCRRSYLGSNMAWKERSTRNVGLLVQRGELRNCSVVQRVMF